MTDVAEQKSSDTIVQYILVRTDLKWTTGALIAQACHASVATIKETIDMPSTRAYLDDLDNMHKVILKTESLDEMMDVQIKLNESKIEHRLWIEKPENVATCLACSPQPKSLVQSIFKHLKLFR